jgi:hypothetical protein
MTEEWLGLREVLGVLKMKIPKKNYQVSKHDYPVYRNNLQVRM